MEGMQHYGDEFGDTFSVHLPTDKDGYLGRECPKEDCKGYFKITPGTGLADVDSIYCPYCGYKGHRSEFHTHDQKEYAISLVTRQITDDFTRQLRGLEFKSEPRGGFGIGMSVEVKPGTPIPIHKYAEKKLETHIVCNTCALKYAVFGVFAYCPDCGIHNSYQQFEDSIRVIQKMLELADTLDADIRTVLIQDALENCVSSFDGYGRELVRININKSNNPKKAEHLSFQNLESAQKRLLGLFGIDLQAGVTSEQWQEVQKAFLKRHLLAHRMDVIDDEYIEKANDPAAIKGHKVSIASEDVSNLSKYLLLIAKHLETEVQRLR